MSEIDQMSRFLIDANSLFLCGTAVGAVAVFDAGSDLNSKTVSTNDWKILAAAISTDKLPITRCETIPSGTNLCRAVEIFGKVIEGESLDKLCQELWKSKILVNRDGYMVRYLGVDGDGEGFVIGNNYLLKLNNLFGWGKYGVKSPEGRIGRTVWNRYEVCGGDAVIDYVMAELETRTKQLRRSEMLAAENGEVLGHYRQILKYKKELMKEMENSENRLKEVLEEKNGVIEEQSRVIQGKETQIWMMTLEKNELWRLSQEQTETDDVDQLIAGR
ncbi:hypothetical protein LINGRAHAP2_LOCUS8573 [Linum grandiflorum]